MRGSRLDAKVKRNTDALWDRLMQYAAAGYLMGAGSNPGSDASPDEKGIVPVRCVFGYEIAYWR